MMDLDREAFPQEHGVFVKVRGTLAVHRRHQPNEEVCPGSMTWNKGEEPQTFETRDSLQAWSLRKQRSYTWRAKDKKRGGQRGASEASGGARGAKKETSRASCPCTQTLTQTS